MNAIFKLPNYPLISELPGIEITNGWRFKRHHEIREWRDQMGVDFNSKLYAFDTRNYPRMIKPKGIYGAIREILYSRICEKLGILCESAQFIILSKEHIDLVKNGPYQAGIFLLAESEPLKYWIGRHYKGSKAEFIEYPVYEVNIKNPDNYYNDQIANILFRHFEPGEYEVTPGGYLVRVDIDTVFCDYILPMDVKIDSKEVEQSVSMKSLQIGREGCEEELREFATTDAKKNALEVICQQVAVWEDEEITKLTDFPLEFQGDFYGPLAFRLITGISRYVAQKFASSIGVKK
jgi:hypothetical protein